MKPVRLEMVWVDVPDSALPAYETALAIACDAVGFFRDHQRRLWRVEGLKGVAANEPALAAGLALAVQISGVEAHVERTTITAEGWLERSYASFPEQLIGKRFCIRGTHACRPPPVGRLTLTIDAGLAFGSGEHGSTRGCIRALELVASRRIQRILDLGTGSGILAMAAARLLHRPVLATDIEPWSVHVAQQNVAHNGLRRLVKVRRSDGWRPVSVRASGPYDLVLANILARPLCRMARDLAPHLAGGGTAILSGLLRTQVRTVLNAHLRCALRSVAAFVEGPWVTLVLRRSANRDVPQPDPAELVSKRYNRAHVYGLRRRLDRKRALSRIGRDRCRTTHGPSSSPFRV